MKDKLTRSKHAERLPADIKQRARRVRMHRKGVLEYDDFSVACLIEEVSAGGFLIACLDEFTVGQRLTLKSEFRPGQTIRCTVEVRHIKDYSLGVAVIDIDEVSAKLCGELMNEYYALTRAAPTSGARR